MPQLLHGSEGNGLFLFFSDAVSNRSCPILVYTPTMVSESDKALCLLVFKLDSLV